VFLGCNEGREVVILPSGAYFEVIMALCCHRLIGWLEKNKLYKKGAKNNLGREAPNPTLTTTTTHHPLVQ
jgi:hypothetical protein